MDYREQQKEARASVIAFAYRLLLVQNTPEEILQVPARLAYDSVGWYAKQNPYSVVADWYFSQDNSQVKHFLDEWTIGSGSSGIWLPIRRRCFVNEYRVSLWVENQGSLPDFDVQFQVVNAAPDPSKLVIAAFLLTGRIWAHLVEIQVLSGGQWVEITRAANVTLNGTSELWFNSSSVR